MNINKINPVNVNLPVKKNEGIKEKPQIEPKHVQASAQDAYGVYGRAMLNIKPVSFGSEEKTSEKKDFPEIKVRNLTDEEFEEYKNKINEKIKTLPDEQQANFNLDFNKSNIFLADRILSDEQLLQNKNLMNLLGDIICSTFTQETAEARVICLKCL